MVRFTKQSQKIKTVVTFRNGLLVSDSNQLDRKEVYFILIQFFDHIIIYQLNHWATKPHMTSAPF